MKVDIEPLFPSRYYHIYNRGINGETLFKQDKNYPYFLKKYALFIPSVADTLAYCLLGNHFHLLAKTKSEEEIRATLKKDFTLENADRVLNPASVKTKTVDKLISLQFSHLFNGYAQAFNKEYNRTGALFERPFRRKEITSDRYLSHVIYYIHANPQSHGFCDDFRSYPHSSYHAHLSTRQTRLDRKQVMSCFGNASEYQKFHNKKHKMNDIRDLIIEFD